MQCYHCIYIYIHTCTAIFIYNYLDEVDYWVAMVWYMIICFVLCFKFTHVTVYVTSKFIAAKERIFWTKIKYFPQKIKIWNQEGKGVNFLYETLFCDTFVSWISLCVLN